MKTSTMKPFAAGDIFIGLTYLDDPDDDHRGEGRIIQFSRDFVRKGTLYTEGTTYLIVGCTFGPDGTLWAFDNQSHTVVRVSSDGKQLDNWNPGRSFGSVNWDNDGALYFGEYLIGREIWQGTTAATLPDGSLGDGNVYKYSPELEHLRTYEVENAPEFTNFKGVTHATMHPSAGYLTYTTETARRLMRYDIVSDRQMDDLDGYPDADPYDRTDQRWFIAPSYLADGRLLCTAADGLRIYDQSGKVEKTIPLPGYGWAQVCPDADQRYALAANIFTGVAARIDLETGELPVSMDTGFAAPFRALAGITVFAG